MKTKAYRGTKMDRAVTRSGMPKYKDGDTVKTAITDDTLLTINGEPSHNGLTWMYSFCETDMRCGQGYIIPQYKPQNKL